jgi:ssDNA-binding replication factor A large subunit
MSANAEEWYQTLMKEGMSEEEIERALKQKKSEFRGFMTTDGMLYLIAKEHGIALQGTELDPKVYSAAEEEIDYDEFTIPIREVKVGMGNIVLVGKITRIFGLREFNRNDGSVGMVGSFILQDVNDSIKIVAWDEKVKPLQSEFFKEGALMQVIGGYSKTGRDGNPEVHVGKRGKLMLSPENVNTKTKKQLDSIQVKGSAKQNFRTETNKITVPLKTLMDENKFISHVEGMVQVEEFKEVTLKSGENTFLLKLLLTDAHDNSARIIIWGEDAVNSLKIVEEGGAYRFHNLMVKDNSYTGEKELSFTRKSSLSPV